MPRTYDDDDDRPRKRPRPRDDDDDEDRPRARRRAPDDDDDDGPRRRKKKARPHASEMSVVGLIALIIGGLALVTAIIPCFASLALIPAGIGLAVGFVALILAQKSDGRQGMGVPITALSVSAVAALIGVGWLVLGKQVEKKFDREMKQMQAETEKEEAARKREQASAAKEVKAAAAGSVMRLTAEQFFKAFEDDPDRADRLYKNKVLELTGVVQAVHIEAGAYGVVLKGGADEGALVECEFADDAGIRAVLSRLTPGQHVTIRGKCLGDEANIEACVLVE